MATDYERAVAILTGAPDPGASIDQFIHEATAKLGVDAPVEYDSRVYDNDAEEILDLLRGQSGDTLLLVGHNPSMHQLVFGLSGGAEARFPTSATAVIGFEGDWPALAVGLPLKGISYQLAFNSELMSLDGTMLRLNVPVPQYAEAAQVAKLKAALAERLGKTVDVQVEVGAARRTAAALDAALRAQRQQDAEREIRQDPFVQSLIRDFGASIVPDSIRPIAPDAGQGAAGSASASH